MALQQVGVSAVRSGPAPPADLRLSGRGDCLFPFLLLVEEIRKAKSRRGSSSASGSYLTVLEILRSV